MPDQWKEADEAMARYAEGDDSAFGALYAVLEQPLLDRLHRKTRDLQVARDLFQQTFLQLIDTRGRFIAGRSIVPYLYRIADHLVIDWARKNHRELLLPEWDAESIGRKWLDGNRLDVTMDAKSALEVVQQVLLRRSAGQRRVFEMVLIDGRELADVAREVGTSANAIKKLMQRLRAAFKEALNGADVMARGRPAGIAMPAKPHAARNAQ